MGTYEGRFRSTAPTTPGWHNSSPGTRRDHKPLNPVRAVLVGSERR